MADFFEDMAEVGTTEESDVSGSDEEEIGRKRKKVKKEKKKKKKAKRMVDSDEDDEEEGEDLDRDLEGLIDDNPVEDEADDVGGKDSESDIDDELEDDEIDLLEENLGIKIDRHKKRKRIREQISSDEESEREQEEGEDREIIAREIFQDDDDLPSERDASHEPEEMDTIAQDLENIDEPEGEEESDYDDFIVDDEGQPISKVKKKKKLVHNDAQLQEAQDIFGVDFDFDEFDQYEDGYDEEDDDDEDEYEDEDEDGEVKPKAKKAQKKKPKGKSIYQLIEPSELERGFHTDRDQEIRTADMPERFQLRSIPVCPTQEGELDEEAEWIHKFAFCTLPVSQQEFSEQDGERAAYRDGRFGSSKGGTCIEKIKKALNFMRNQQFEVPFIAFYRKEYVETELNINDLWRVYHWDEKWMQLRSRKQNLVRLLERMQNYQFEEIDPDKPLDSHIRTLTEDDIIRAKNVQSLEELRDVYEHFVLYYGPDIPKMKAAYRVKKRKEREAARLEAGETQPEEEHEDEDDTHKQGFRKTGYTLCIQAGLAELARKFGLSPEQFAENLRDNYGRNDIEQDPAHPQELAQEFVCQQFSTPDDVLKGARHVVAMQIAHEPLVIECVRTAVYDRAKITTFPTKKGMKEIDEGQQCYTFKYLKNKPVREVSNDQFLKLVQAEQDGLMTFELHLDLKDSKNVQTYFDEIKSLYTLDEFSNLVQDWNSEREQALERALNLILYPRLLKELRSKLLDEAKEHVVRSCSLRLYNWLKVAPYTTDQQLDDDDDDYDMSKGLRVMGVAFSQDWSAASFGVIIDGNGDVTDYMRLKNITKRKDAWRKEDREDKLADLEKIKSFILNKKPHVIALVASCRDAMMIQEDLVSVVTELEQEHQIAPISIELVDSELAAVYSNSKKAEHDFRDYPELLRQAISVARRLQDPLVEFCQLCNPDEDILALKFHPLQDEINKEVLLNALYLEFINRVNEVGVDVDACVNHQHKAPLIQFVCGLGPRKGFHLLKILRQKNNRLENRTQLVTMCRMGPKVFINCAGFIKIDTSALGDSTEAYVEVLDGSRVHPETYDWARKMAVDALEYDDTAEDANPAGALEEILESPDRLRDLDLDAFAVELEKQGYGNRQITLYDIRAELNHRYKDLRIPYRPPSSEERFNMLTKESPQTFHIGKMIMCTVTGIAHKRPKGDQLDQANPVRNDETGLWQCPFCNKNDFPELSEVWNHFDANECRGQAVGVKTRLDNSVSGFLPLKNLSDKHVRDPEERVQVAMTLHCRITKIDIDRFQVELTSKSSDLSDKENKWKLQKDSYYDFEKEEQDIKREQDKKQKQAKQTYVKRVIAHPSFHNVDYKTTEKLMANMEQGDVVIRPSSKGTDHLTATWKVADDILQHLDIREEGKENAFSLGTSLWIGNEEFEDLDEIIARHIQPMAAFARDIYNYKYYKDSNGGAREPMEKICIDEKRKAPSKIPYYFTSCKQYPGKFMLFYLPRKDVRCEFVSVAPDGIRYRQQLFTSLNSLVRWFKEHFRDPIPGTPMGMKTPMGQAAVGATPNINLHNVDAATIQRAAAGLPSSIYNTLAQVAGQTPFTGFNQYQTPMMTPMMTPVQQQPYMTPAGMGTPMATPSQNVGGQYMGSRGNWPGNTTRVPSGQTPRQTPRPGQTTPRNQPGQTTPRHYSVAPSPHQGGSTPRQYPTDGSTPQHRSSVASSGQRSSRGSSQGGSSSSQDWAKMAEQWAKQRLAEQGSERSRRTPRTEQSPRGTPRGTPRGDATPLFDER